MYVCVPKLLVSIRFSSGLTLAGLASASSLGYIGNLFARPDLITVRGRIIKIYTSYIHTYIYIH